MASRYESGSFNGRSDPGKRAPKPRPVVHVPSRPAQRDDIDAALAARLWAITDGIVEKHKAQYPHHKGNQR